MKIAVREPTPTELVEIERHDAWLQYLEELRGQPTLRYDQVEPWAWERLQARLRRLKARRTR